MYVHAIAGSVAAGVSLPYFHLGSLDIGIPIQSFGVIVAAGVLIGAALLRRYAEWHGVSDEHIRGILGWITIAGFLGAHVLDVLFYPDPDKVQPPVATWPPSSWPHILRIWDGISSYGGFVGGAIGFAIYVWWKRLPIRLFADISIVGLLPAFSIGRIGCTVVSDHVGAVVDKANWYAFLAMNYPVTENLPVVSSVIHPKCGQEPVSQYCIPDPTVLGGGYKRDAAGAWLSSVNDGSGVVTMWNLGLIEFLYLIPVNIVILYLAFRPSKRLPAGFIAILTGVLYAPFRFFLDYLRPDLTDARHAGLTFAQWCSLIAFGVSVYVASRILKGGTAAEVVAPTSGEAQRRLKVILKEDEEKAEQDKDDKKFGKKDKKDEDKAKLPAAKVVDKKKAADDDEDGDEVPETEANEVKKPKADDKADKKAEKADDKAEKKADKAADKAEKKAEKADDKAEKADDKAEKKAAEKADEKKADDKAENKADDKKADDKKADDK